MRKKKKLFSNFFGSSVSRFEPENKQKKSCSRSVSFLCSLFFLLVSWTRNSFVFFAALHYLFWNNLKPSFPNFNFFVKRTNQNFFLLSLQTENFFLAFLLVFQVENGPKRRTLVKKKAKMTRKSNFFFLCFLVKNVKRLNQKSCWKVCFSFSFLLIEDNFGALNLFFVCFTFVL